jgi:hypothetical protein
MKNKIQKYFFWEQSVEEIPKTNAASGRRPFMKK